MEKLIKYLNEYQTTVNKELNVNISWYYSDVFKALYHSDEDDLREGDNFNGDIAENYAISKKFGFIKWLVENDKIDLRKLDYKVSDVDIPTRYYLGTYIRYSIENEILMSLAIQDNPIEFLISLLKNV